MKCQTIFLAVILHLLAISLLQPKKAVFCLFLGLRQNAAKLNMVTQFFSLLCLILMIFRIHIPSFIEISMWEPSQKKLQISKIDEFMKTCKIKYTRLLIWLTFVSGSSLNFLIATKMILITWLLNIKHHISPQFTLFDSLKAYLSCYFFTLLKFLRY